jgi:hypothetical protein
MSEAAPAFGCAAAMRQCRQSSDCRRTAAAATARRPSIAQDLNPLFVEPILGHIMAFVGAGEGLFIAGVSRAWREAYVRHSDASNSDGLCITSYASAVASLPRLEMAWQCGLGSLSDSNESYSSWPFCRAVTAAQPAVLAWARDHGMLRSACA